MEETATPPPATVQALKPTPIVVHKSNNAPLVGAIIFLALVIAAAAVYLGMKKTVTPQQAALPTPTQTVVATPTTAPTPTTASAVLQTFTSTKLTGTSFPIYTISYPETWVKDNMKDAVTDTLTLTKGDYQIKIYQAPMGGGGCTFKGDTPAEMSQDFSSKEFVEIKAGDVTLRRVETTSVKPGTTTYTFCAATTSSKGAFGSPTSFGAITYTTPTTPDAATLLEMDGIIQSLK